MADSKISDLAASTTPLAGTELAVIVQGGVTKKVAVSEIAGTGTTNLTTKGDLESFTTFQTRFPIGTDGQVLKADSSTAHGLIWATPTGADANIQVAVSDETTDLTTGTAKLTFRMPHSLTLTEVRASVTTAPTGSVLTVDVNQTAATILSTKITIDATEKTSTTAVALPVISTSALTDDAEITIDIDTIGSTIAGAGLKVTLIGTRP